MLYSRCPLFSFWKAPFVPHFSHQSFSLTSSRSLFFSFFFFLLYFIWNLPPSLECVCTVETILVSVGCNRQDCTFNSPGSGPWRRRRWPSPLSAPGSSLLQALRLEGTAGDVNQWEKKLWINRFHITIAPILYSIEITVSLLRHLT